MIKGKIKLPLKIKGKIDGSKIYPALEDLEVTPSYIEQNFKSAQYGYDNVKVKAIESEEIVVIPTTEDQIKEGMYNKVTVLGDSDLIPENIRKGTEIFGVEGQMLAGWDTSSIRNCNGLFENNNDLIEAPLFDTQNVTTMNNMFYKCQNLQVVPTYNTSKVTEMQSMFSGCTSLQTAPYLDTSLVDNMSSMFSECTSLKTVPKYNAEKVNRINYIFYKIYNSHKLENIGGFENLGKAYTSKNSNYSQYKLELAMNTVTAESLRNIINNLYDLNLTYDVANGGTLYTQSLRIYGDNLAKLTQEEIAIATSKGWNVS